MKRRWGKEGREREREINPQPLLKTIYASKMSKDNGNI